MLLFLLVQAMNERIGQSRQKINQFVRMQPKVGRVIIGLHGPEHLIQILLCA